MPRERTPFAPTDGQLAGLDDSLRCAGADHDHLAHAQMICEATETRLMGTKITAVDVHDVRFPTAATADGSDAINSGDYSATYVELRTDAGPTGAGLTFTNGRGNEITCAAVRAFDDHVVGRTMRRSSTSRSRSGAHSPQIPSSAGSVRRRASSTWPRGPSSTPSEYAGQAGRGADVAAAGADAGRRVGAMRRLPSHLGRAHTQEAHTILQEGSVGWEDRLAALEQSGFPGTPPQWGGWATRTRKSGP